MWTLPVVAVTAVVLAVGTVPQSSGAQPHPVVPRPLQPARSVASDEFLHVRSVRELSDGRTLVSDDFDHRVVVVDWTTGQSVPVGRTGSGPGEYKSVGRMFVLGGDSTLLDDHGSLRWLILERSAIIATLSATARPFGGQGALLCGADRRGGVCELRPSVFRQALPGLPLFRTLADAESLLVLRTRIGSARVDTVARMRGRFRGIREKRVGGVGYVYYNPLGTEEQALLFSDGWLAIARASPYRVEWIRPEGTHIMGAPLPTTTVNADEREKQNAITVYERNLQKLGLRAEDFPNWPLELPPFHNNALHASADGQLVIERTSSARIAGRIYDVVDRRGVLVSRFSLGARERLVGLGARWAYVVVFDDDDVEHLRRHPWP